jgi:hypothetical protein
MTEQIHNEAADMARFAGITVPEDRVAALTGGLALSRQIAARLAALDFGRAEPADRFLPPTGPRP